MEEKPFDQLFDESLAEAERLGDVETVLERHPEQADLLRPLMELALATSEHYADVPEPPGGLAAGRDRMLAAAAQQREERTQAVTVPIFRREVRIPKMRLAFATRLIAIVLAVLVGLGAVGGGVAAAASNSLPGDPLYPVKLAVEDLRMAVTSNPEAQVRLSLQLADERMAEIDALTGNGLSVPEEVYDRMERSVGGSLNQAAQAHEEEIPVLLEQIVQRTHIQLRELDRIRANAPEQDQLRLESTQRTCQQFYGEAQAGLEDPVAFQLHMQQRTNAPEDAPVPDPPDGGNGPGQQEPGGPNEDPPQGPQGNQDQEQHNQPDPQGDPQQNQEGPAQDPPQGDAEQPQGSDNQQQGDGEPQQEQEEDPPRGPGRGEGGYPTPTPTPTATPTPANAPESQSMQGGSRAALGRSPRQ